MFVCFLEVGLCLGFDSLVLVLDCVVGGWWFSVFMICEEFLERVVVFFIVKVKLVG